MAVSVPRSHIRSPLTAAETDVLRALADGLHVNEIAASRHVSRRTVQGQLNSCYIKLGATSRCHAVALALRAGWIK
jgi:DNA-binding NarL/FixJ family response regulator